MGFLVLLVYIFTFLVRPHEWGGIDRESAVITYALLGALGFYMLQRDKNLSTPQLPLMFFLLVAIALSVAMNGWVAGALTQGEVFVRTALIPFILMSALISTHSRQYAMFFVVLGCSILMVINGHTQVISEDGIGMLGNPVLQIGSSMRIRYLGYLSDPNDLGMLFVMVIPLAVLFKDKAPSALKFLFWGATLALLYGVYLTNSRGTLLATMSLLGLWFWRKYKLKKTLFVGGAMSPVLLIVMSNFRTISAEEESAQGRLDAWYAGYQMLQSNPLFGVGNGAFLDYHDLTAHNSFVLAFAEMGFLGCFAWVSLLTVTLLGLEEVSRSNYIPDGITPSSAQANDARQEAMIATALLYSFLGYMVSGFFLSRTYFPLLYLYIGMGAACTHRASLIFKKPKAIYDLKKSSKWAFGITIGGIFAVNILVRVFI